MDFEFYLWFDRRAALRAGQLSEKLGQPILYVIRIGTPPADAHDAQQVSLYALDSSTAQPPAAAMSPQDLNWCGAYPCSAVSACTTSGAASLHPVWVVFENVRESATNVRESVMRMVAGHAAAPLRRQTCAASAVSGRSEQARAQWARAQARRQRGGVARRCGWRRGRRWRAHDEGNEPL